MKFELLVYTVVGKESSWFIKLNEDAMPDFNEVKERLKKLSEFVHESLAG